jgi:tRNA (guanine37-N1)-methyltransferase
MDFEIITIFPGFFESLLQHGLLKRAMAAGKVAIRLHDLRRFAEDRHHTVDDRPFGGGPGMVFKPQPLFAAVEAIEREHGVRRQATILLSPQGRLLTQAVAAELAGYERLILVCGRYEGVDERVVRGLGCDEISIGDFVLSGGELPAAVLMESVTRLLPGVLGNEESATEDSFAVPAGEGAGLLAEGLLDCPHYTRPASFRGMEVPEVLLSGDHARIRQWRRRQSLEKTWQRRPDLLQRAALSEDDLRFLEQLRGKAAAPPLPAGSTDA